MNLSQGQPWANSQPAAMQQFLIKIPRNLPSDPVQPPRLTSQNQSDRPEAIVMISDTQNYYNNPLTIEQNKDCSHEKSPRDHVQRPSRLEQKSPLQFGNITFPPKRFPGQSIMFGGQENYMGIRDGQERDLNSKKSIHLSSADVDAFGVGQVNLAVVYYEDTQQLTLQSQEEAHKKLNHSRPPQIAPCTNKKRTLKYSGKPQQFRGKTDITADFLFGFPLEITGLGGPSLQKKQRTSESTFKFKKLEQMERIRGENVAMGRTLLPPLASAPERNLPGNSKMSFFPVNQERRHIDPPHGSSLAQTSLDLQGVPRSIPFSYQNFPISANDQGNLALSSSRCRAPGQVSLRKERANEKNRDKGTHENNADFQPGHKLGCEAIQASSIDHADHSQGQPTSSVTFQREEMFYDQISCPKVKALLPQGCYVEVIWGIPLDKLPAASQTQQSKVPSSKKYKFYQFTNPSTKRILKVLKCEHVGCGKVFTKWFNFYDHLRSHTQERPYQCPFNEQLGCRYSFTQKSNLKKHLIVHFNRNPSLKDKLAEEQSELFDSLFGKRSRPILKKPSL